MVAAAFQPATSSHTRCEESPIQQFALHYAFVHSGCRPFDGSVLHFVDFMRGFVELQGRRSVCALDPRQADLWRRALDPKSCTLSLRRRTTHCTTSSYASWQLPLSLSDGCRRECNQTLTAGAAVISECRLLETPTLCQTAWQSQLHCYNSIHRQQLPRMRGCVCSKHIHWLNGIFFQEGRWLGWCIL